MPNHDSDREHLLNALYDSLADSPWHGFLIELSHTFASSHASLVIDAGGFDDGSDPVVFVSRDDISESVRALYRSGFFKTSAGERPDERDGVPLAGGGPDMPYGLARTLTTSVICWDRGTAHLTLWRKQDGGAFNESAHMLLRDLVPALKRGLKLFFQNVELQRRLLISTAALETSGIGIILAEPDGTKLMTNAIADTLLANGAGLCLSRGKLKATNPDDTALLLVGLRRMAAEQQAETDWRVYAPLALRRPNSVLPLTVIVRPGPPFHPLTNPLQRTALLVLRDPEHKPIIPASTLAHLFGLTPAEALLASEMARGANIEEAAGRIGISRNTARSQLQSVFLKTGTNRQGDLVRVLLSSAASLST